MIMLFCSIKYYDRDKYMIRFIISVLLGLIMGVVSKAGDVAVQGTFYGDLLWNMGLVTTGFLIWCLVGYFNAITCKNLKSALINNTLFFLSMLLSYYLYSYFVVGYLNRRIVVFWLMMIIPVLIATKLIRKYQRNKKFKALTITAVGILFLTDVIIIQGFELISLIIELILMTGIMIMIVKCNAEK